MNVHAAPVPAVNGIRRMDALVGALLLAGVLASLALIASGLAWSYLTTGRLGLGYRLAGMNLFQLTALTLRQTFTGPWVPSWLINAGIVALMLTPFLRVCTSVVYFAAALRNVKYTAFTLFVLLVLGWSLFLRG